MKENRLKIKAIPAILYGDESDKLFLYVHGRYASKEEAQRLAGYALLKGYQVLGFDLPEHGDRVNENYKCNMPLTTAEQLRATLKNENVET